MRQSNSLHPILRTAFALFTFVTVYFLTEIPILELIGDRHLTLPVPLIAAGAAAIGVWANAADKRRSTRIALCTALGSAILGGIGLVAGFVGPLIFAPQANQGPLLGIFITGPLGFVLGAMLGFTFALLRKP